MVCREKCKLGSDSLEGKGHMKQMQSLEKHGLTRAVSVEFGIPWIEKMANSNERPCSASLCALIRVRSCRSKAHEL